MDHIFESSNLGYRLFNEDDAEVFFNNHNEEKFKHWFPGNGVLIFMCTKSG